MEKEVLQGAQDTPSVTACAATAPLTQGSQGSLEVGRDDVGIVSYEAPSGARGEVGSDTRHVARKLLHRVEQVLDSDEPLNPQAMKHISGILKDVRDILAVREDQVDSGAVTVTFAQEIEGFAQ